MKKTEDSLRRLKKGKKSTFSLFGGSTREDDGRDEERIRTQMILDVEAFGKDGELLGVSLEQSESFKSLTGMVHAVDREWIELSCNSERLTVNCTVPDAA